MDSVLRMFEHSDRKAPKDEENETIKDTHLLDSSSSMIRLIN